MSERVSYPDAEYDCGDRLLCKADYQQSWSIGIVTDVFRAPISGQYVYVINGTGYYEDEVSADIPAPEPQSLKA